MNICLLTSTFFPLIGGLEIVVHNLATSLTYLGHNVYLVTPYRGNRKLDKDYNYRIIHFGFRGCNKLRLVTPTVVLTLAYVVKRFKIDVINVHNVRTPGFWAYSFRQFFNKIPIVGTPHGDDIQITPEIQDGVRLNPESDKIVRRNLAMFTRITSISESIRQDLYQLVGNKEKIIDVPNGVWVQNFQQKINSAEIRKNFGIPLDTTAVISVGRNHPRKGFQYGLDAVAKLQKNGADISYILVGRNMSPIIEKARSLGISDCLITPGEVNAEIVSQLLQSSDIYVSPSIVESFGLSTLEAMSAGLPCVVTDIPGSRDLVSIEYGMLVEKADSDKLADAIKYLVENPSVRNHMGIKACNEAWKYNWPKIAKMYIEVYQEAIYRNITALNG